VSAFPDEERDDPPHVARTDGRLFPSAAVPPPLRVVLPIGQILRFAGGGRPPFVRLNLVRTALFPSGSAPHFWFCFVFFIVCVFFLWFWMLCVYLFFYFVVICLVVFFGFFCWGFVGGWVVCFVSLDGLGGGCLCYVFCVNGMCVWLCFFVHTFGVF